MNPSDTIPAHSAVLAALRERTADMPGVIDGGVHGFSLRTYFEDTDLSGAVYHARYLNFLERARNEFLRCAGIDQRAAFAEGVFVVSDMHLRYRRPARFGDLLFVISRITKVRTAAVEMDQRIFLVAEAPDAPPALLLDAQVVAAFITPPDLTGASGPDAGSEARHAQAGRPRRHPPEWRACFEALCASASGANAAPPARAQSPNPIPLHQTGTKA